ncbi:hypothetical protein Plhal304r1_c012g0047271 [Plasmopara halstedii]
MIGNVHPYPPFVCCLSMLDFRVSVRSRDASRRPQRSLNKADTVTSSLVCLASPPS